MSQELGHRKIEVYKGDIAYRVQGVLVVGVEGPPAADVVGPVDLFVDLVAYVALAVGEGPLGLFHVFHP